MKTGGTTDDILDEASAAMDASCVEEILGQVRFEGEDGKTYEIFLETNIIEVDKDEELSAEEIQQLKDIIGQRPQ